MSGPYPRGGMSPKGTTTPVYINFAEVDQKDKDVLCMAICECKAVPDVGKDGQSLRQGCVSKMLTMRDRRMDSQSEYKAEVNYDMTKNPPAPIMDRSIATKVHDWLPGWLRKWWDDDPEHPPFEAGEGMVRRPDVVIVKDPRMPPTQDNIKQVVEIKFDDDTWGSLQAEDYEKISGRGKLVELTPKKCACDDPDRKKRTENIKNTALKDDVLEALDALASKGRGGVRRRLPKKLPNLKD
jgi:hypothetical protein